MKNLLPIYESLINDVNNQNKLLISLFKNKLDNIQLGNISKRIFDNTEFISNLKDCIEHFS